MLISIPCAVGIFTLAEPIINLLFTNTSEVLSFTSKLLMALSVSVIFYALSTLNSSILQGIGKVNAPIINACIALVLQTAIAVILLICTDLGIYSIIIANIVYSGVMCILNQRAVRKAIGYKQEYKKNFSDPYVRIFCHGSAHTDHLPMSISMFGQYESCRCPCHSIRNRDIFSHAVFVKRHYRGRYKKNA